MDFFKNYAENAMRTCAPLPTTQDDVVHMVFGMITEVGELVDVFKKNMAYKKEIDWVNVKEEIGDLMWYIANLCTFLNISFTNIMINSSFVIRTPISSVLKMSEDVGFLASAAFAFQDNGEITVYIRNDLLVGTCSLVDDIACFCNSVNFNLPSILEKNIAKLRARYPDKFTCDNAINRDLDSERTILEE